MHDHLSSSASTLSLAIDCNGASHRLPDPLAGRLRALAAKEDEIFCALSHDVKATGGFILNYDAATGAPQSKPTALWLAANDAETTARIGMMCVSRYENSGRVAYRELIHATADCYLNTIPGDRDDVWAGTIGQAITLELAACRDFFPFKFPIKIPVSASWKNQYGSSAVVPGGRWMDRDRRFTNIGDETRLLGYFNLPVLKLWRETNLFSADIARFLGSVTGPQIHDQRLDRETGGSHN